jgi:S-DNA-T family DNA segregation ATPase FtsK/SpoIIIE
MFEKLINFIKIKLLQIISLLIVTTGVIFFISIVSYSAYELEFTFFSNSNFIEKIFKPFQYTSDFFLQIFGIISIFIPFNLCVWGSYFFFKKNIQNFLLKCIYLILYLILGGVFFSIISEKSFFLPDHGLGGFFGNFITNKFFLKDNNFSMYISLALIALTIFFIYLSLDLKKDEWKIFFLKFFIFLNYLPSYIYANYIKKDLSKKTEENAVFNKIEVAEKELEQADHKISLQPDLPLEQKNVKNLTDFKLPQLKLLDNPIKIETKEDLDMQEKQSRFLENVLLDFGVTGEIKKVSAGPVVTLYEFEPTAGIKTSKIINLSEDIARNTSSVSTRVATVIGKNTIGIEIPNKFRESVALKEIISSKEFNNKEIKIPITLGKSISGFPIVGDLASMPHLLIAGTTGSGKSVCINTLILSILFRYTPAECKLILIDPKMLELSMYQGIPHLLVPVITEPKKATVALKWVVREMEKRYREMTEFGVRNIYGFNDKSSKKMPYLIVVVDEMADLMMIAGKEIENYIQRLAQMARAAGIHIVMATQRPSVDVITGTIKANFPTRISFQVTSKIDSRTILGEQGAELLLGQGDMLFMSSASRIVRIHGPYVSEKEIEKVATYLRLQGNPTYVEEITKIDELENDEPILNQDGKDELYNKAVEIIRTEGKASTSFLQRKLGIGYNRAARMIDQMEEEKIISPANHIGKREIY